MKERSKIWFLGAAISAVLLVSCGGGGSGSTTSSQTPITSPSVPMAPATPTLNVSYDLKELVFSWVAVSGADYYTLSERESAGAPYVELDGNITTTAYSHNIESVHLHDWLNSSYILEACNTVGCSSSSELFPMDSAAAIGFLKASNTQANDQFGFAVAVSDDGSTLAVGANSEDSNSTGINSVPNDDGFADQSGAVYVFTNVAGIWEQQAFIKASNTGADDRFGSSLALSQDGHTLVVGARNEDHNDDGTADNSGAVYVFSWEAGVWTQQAYLKASNADAGDLFGRSVALSADGNTLAIGADGESGASGSVYIFTRNYTPAATWSEQTIIQASNAQANDSFGFRVALSDDGLTLAASAIWEDSVASGIGGDQGNDPSVNTNAGAVYIFTWDGVAWSQEEYIKPSNMEAGDNFGVSLALSSDGDTLAVGANHEDSNAITVNGDEADNSANAAGAAYAFSRSLGGWSQQAYLKAFNGQQDDEFGYAIAMSDDGNRLLVSAWGEDSDAIGVDGNQLSNAMNGAGAAYFFTRTGAVWSQDVYLKASNTGPSDVFGAAVDVSGDAATLLIGGFGESSNATGVSGDQTDNSAGVSGAAYLY